jgi:hypothetical protein
MANVSDFHATIAIAHELTPSWLLNLNASGASLLLCCGHNVEMVFLNSAVECLEKNACGKSNLAASVMATVIGVAFNLGP